jgi:hypothetical protein
MAARKFEDMVEINAHRIGLAGLCPTKTFMLTASSVLVQLQSTIIRSSRHVLQESILEVPNWRARTRSLFKFASKVC